MKNNLPPLSATATEPKAARNFDPLDEYDQPEEADDASDLVRIVNKLPRLMHLPDKIVTASGPEGPRITGVGTGKSLQPGGNNVPRALWEALKGQPHGAKLDPRIDRGHARRMRGVPGHKTVREWIKLGFLVEEGDATQPEGPEAPGNLSTFGPETAIMMAEGEDSPDVLKRWLKTEARPEVQTAIRKQIQAIGVKPPQN